LSKSVYTRKYKKLIESLRDARIAMHLTQADVAKALKRPQSFVSKFESGERRIDVVELIEICRIYRITPERILKAVQSA